MRTLDAVSIIALTPAQLATWPQELIDEFDEEIRIKSFKDSEIHEMIAKRVRSTSREHWNPPKGLVQEIEDRTSGHPSESIKLMRKIVHCIKNEGDYDSELNQVLSNIKSKIDDNQDYIEEEPEEIIQIEEEIQEFSDLENLDIEIIEEDTKQIVQIEEEIEKSFFDDGFIDEEIQNQDEFEELEYNEDVNNILPEQIQAPLPKGGFGKLSGRTRNTNESMRKDGFAVFPSDFEAMRKQQEPPSLESPVLETEDIALWIDDQIISKTTFGNEQISKINNKQIIQEKSTFEGALKEIQDNNSINLPEQSFNLDIERLRSLEDNEIKVIQLCSKREISPSDEEMRDILGGIGRTRVSQIFNGLNKHGILSVKKVGRSRMFYLSNSAKSQLMAWGIL